MRNEAMNKRFWTWPIAIYLFLGGLGGGTLFVSAIFYLLGIGDTLGFTIFCGLAMLALGCLLLIFELGQPKLFVRAFITKTAIIKWGAVLLSVALIFGAVWWVFYWPAEWNLFWYSWREIETLCVVVAMVASMGLMIYTGVLLSTMKSKPFWNTPAVPILFTISAMSTGCALAALTLGGSPIDFLMFQMIDWYNYYYLIEYSYCLYFLHLFDTILIVAELIVLLLFTVLQYSSNEITAKTVATRWLVGETKIIFWGGMIICGLVIPLLGYLFGAEGILGLYVSPILALCGGLLLRFLFVYNNDRREIPGTELYYEKLPSKDAAFLHPYWDEIGGAYTPEMNPQPHVKTNFPPPSFEVPEGLEYDPKTKTAWDAEAGLRYDPETGRLVDPQTDVSYDLETRYAVDGKTNTLVDEATGAHYDMETKKRIYGLKPVPPAPVS